MGCCLSSNAGKLIISTGDVSDIDGFCALAQYAKTGADMIFIMNYPAFVGVPESEVDDKFAESHPGMGYKYSAKQVLENVPASEREKVSKFLATYEGDDNAKMKSALTDIAFTMAYKVWNEGPENRGRLFFCIGGVNAINPFSAKAIKNEVVVNANLIKRPELKFRANNEGDMYNEQQQRCQLDFFRYSDIYIDFNGSMAFWTEEWIQRYFWHAEIVKKVRGAFVMGGVYSDEKPLTMPSIPNVLNRFSSATMNQLYHSKHSAAFFEFLAKHEIPTYTITNNVVHDLTTFDDSDSEKKKKTIDGVNRFMEANGLNGKFLKEAARVFYESVYNPPRKCFDFYTALALSIALRGKAATCLEDLEALRSRRKKLFYSDKYGMTFVSNSDSWGSTIEKYFSTIETNLSDEDSPFVKTKKENFRKEIEIMQGLSDLPSLDVLDVEFVLDAKTKRLSIKPFKKLIISTGDVSDIDGFCALAQYAKTGADAVFIMNYPAFVGVPEAEVDDKFAESHPGMGYKYSAKQVLENVPASEREKVSKFLATYEGDDNAKMKSALTDIAFVMAYKVWNEGPAHRGRLFFCIGGVNAINPFSAKAIKNEVVVNSYLEQPKAHFRAKNEGDMYDEKQRVCELNLLKYNDIYIDFNGSMAFWTEEWVNRYFGDAEIVKKVRGAFVMGGVYSDEKPLTMPSVPNVLNRFSSATMNQLYHSENAAEFFRFLSKHKIPTYTITNNVVQDLTTFDDSEKKMKTLDGVNKFMEANGLDGKFLKEAARVFYESIYNPPRKCFDFYTALVVTAAMEGHRAEYSGEWAAIHARKMKMFYSDKYGMTFVSNSDDWSATLDNYTITIDTVAAASDVEFIRTKKENFRKEIEIMQSLRDLPSLDVFDVTFNLHAKTKKLAIKPSKSLIISTGDVSDIDGFCALAQYAKTGADAVFIMNFPAFVGVPESEVDNKFAESHPGLGYKYCAKQLLENVPAAHRETVSKFLATYEGDDNAKMKSALTDIAFVMAHKVWNEGPANRGRLLFCIGGVNAINPFSAKAIKNEVVVNAGIIEKPVKKFRANNEGQMYDEKHQRCDLQLSKYADIYIDFNGSMAFWTEDWVKKYFGDEETVKKVKGAFVMGGVYSDEAPLTMPSIPNVLNRFSSATMNQLYHSKHSAAFFEFLAKHEIPTYTITNNVVHDLTTFADSEKKVKSLHGVEDFMKANGLDGKFLRKAANVFYLSHYSPPRKCFDFYTALVLSAAMKGELAENSADWAAIRAQVKKMFYSDKYGITMVSQSDKWQVTLENYVRTIDTVVTEKDSDFIKTKKENFRKEIDIVQNMRDLPALDVFDVAFDIDAETKKLAIKPFKKLIISTGDVSDIDGFCALAQYAKTGADAVFIMNYPAFVGVPEAEVDDKFAESHPGMGYKYSAKQVLENVPVSEREKVSKFLATYEGDDNAKMKSALTDIAFVMAHKVWNEGPAHRGRLFFCIGGVNAINPFSAKAIKNEVVVNASLIDKPKQRFLFDNEGQMYDEKHQRCELKLSKYADIYIDFNGSMAFWTDAWVKKYFSDLETARKVRGAFVMGGVYSDEAPLTMPSIPNVLNRFSSATMNQLYHPQNTAAFFEYLDKHKIPTYTITNNVVYDLTTFADPEKKVKSIEGVSKFMEANGLDGKFLKEAARVFYECIYNPPRKCFDFYTALALTAALLGDRAEFSADRAAIQAQKKKMFFSDKYGVTLVSQNNDWQPTFENYVRTVDTVVTEKDSDFIKTKKENFRKEIDIVQNMKDLPALDVFDVAFDIDAETKKLAIKPFKKLIISTGDVSDIDGFCALAQYAKTGADAVFIMNFPAFVGVPESEVDETFAQSHPGLGFKYSAKQVLENVPAAHRETVSRFLATYEGDDNAKMKSALTDIAFVMAHKVWNEGPENRGRLFFCIGGVNAINPFSAKAIKNEVVVNAGFIDKPKIHFNTDNEGQMYDEKHQRCELQLSRYADIYIDFNGSMAFWTEDWVKKYFGDLEAVTKVRGAFVMGGVYSDEKPLTMPSIPNVLNRFSSATMNQLYHSKHSAAFFEFLAKHKIPTYTITNNVVHDLTTFADPEKKMKTLEGVNKFMEANGLDGKFLTDAARVFYESVYSPPRKCFDFYTALAVTVMLSGNNSDNAARWAALHARPCRLFYSEKYGMTFVSKSEDWANTLSNYTSTIDTTVVAGDVDFVKTKKQNFEAEIGIMRAQDALPSLEVYDVQFVLQPSSRLDLVSVEQAA